MCTMCRRGRRNVEKWSLDPLANVTMTKVTNIPRVTTTPGRRSRCAAQNTTSRLPPPSQDPPAADHSVCVFYPRGRPEQRGRKAGGAERGAREVDANGQVGQRRSGRHPSSTSSTSGLLRLWCGAGAPSAPREGRPRDSSSSRAIRARYVQRHYYIRLLPVVHPFVAAYCPQCAGGAPTGSSTQQQPVARHAVVRRSRAHRRVAPAAAAEAPAPTPGRITQPTPSFIRTSALLSERLQRQVDRHTVYYIYPHVDQQVAVAN